jgi:hypothetical protein
MNMMKMTIIIVLLAEAEKEFAFTNKHEERVHKQKHILLCNFNEAIVI